MSCVLFTSNRQLNRAENLKAVYDAYDGEKRFARFCDVHDLHSGRYSLQVSDELPVDTVGKCLFIWHGMGACKTYGLDQPHPYFKNPSLVTYAIASSKDIVPIAAKLIGISESQIIPTGMPRTDAYFKAEMIATEPRKFLYAPTFRGGDWKPNWNKLHMRDGDELVVKPHMLTRRLTPNGKMWKQITEYNSKYPTAPHLMWCDVLITDYSSIMFDAYVMRKPAVLFAKDKEYYLKTRGVYLPYPYSYSDYYCDKEEELMDMAHEARWNDNFERIRNFHAGACDGHATERVLDLIRSMI